jgi:hypothetical protein
MNEANEWLEIFKPGQHIASNGRTFNFTEADVSATARAYSPELHAAPLVVGHPAMDDPAYGWTQSLAFADHKLTALPVDVDPAFAELVNSRRYSKISAAFYHPDSPVNPVPGVYYLRHVGFLGAHPPAVQGLKSPSFASGDSMSEVICFAFGEARQGQGDNADIARRAIAYKDKLLALNCSISLGEAIDAVASGEDRIEFGEPAPKNMSNVAVARLARAYKAEMGSKGKNISVAEAVNAVTGGWN